MGKFSTGSSALAWAGLGKFGQVWVSLGKFGQVGTSLEKATIQKNGKKGRKNKKREQKFEW